MKATSPDVGEGWKGQPMYDVLILVGVFAAAYVLLKIDESRRS